MWKQNKCKNKDSDIVSISESFGGGRNRTRTCDPIDVNDVLYQLSHATLFGWLGFPSATNKIIAWFIRYVKGFFLFFCQSLQNSPAIFIRPSSIIAPPPTRRIIS